MKAEVYIFGVFSEGYSQYPDNYTRNLFKTVSNSRRGASEIVYHREGSLTYYIYTREISRSSNTFLGLCYVFNDIVIKDFGFLFGVFEDAITNIVVKGELLEFTDDGSLSTNVSQLYTSTEELQRVSDYLNGKLSSLGRYAEKLPPANYSVSTSEGKTYSYEQIDDAQEALSTYANIRVVKGDNYDSDALKGYASKLRSLDNNIHSLQQQIEVLKDENVKLNRKKNKFIFVIILSLLLLIGASITTMIIINKNDDINNKIAKIESLYQTNLSLETQIEGLNNDIEDLNKNYDKLKGRYNSVNESYLDCKNKYETLTTSIKGRQPFIITKTAFNFGSGVFTMDYLGLTSGYYTIKINVYADNTGSRVRSEVYNDYWFDEGENTKSFYITSSLNSSYWYYFEVCIDNVIVGGRRH